MSNITDTINAIRLTNNLYNTQVISLLKTAQDDINQIIIKTQTDLINKIAQDYNISSRELSRKYLLKPKKGPGRKPKEEHIDDSPTMQGINDLKNGNDSDDDNIVNIMVNPAQTQIGQFLSSVDILNSNKTLSPKNPNAINPNIHNVLSQLSNGEKTELLNTNTNNNTNTDSSSVNELVFKTIKIKNADYLLNLETNEIYDMENNLVGKKQNNKYMMKKINENGV
jgi:hypothetical protein